jgi:hypothetical protein
MRSVKSVQIMALCLVTATASANAPNNGSQCTAVGGTVTTNFIDPNTTLGPATGDLAGAVSATLLRVVPGSDNTTVFTVQHHWTTDGGDSILVKEADARAIEIAPQLFAIVSYPVTIVGGTGKFARARGTLHNIGEVDLNTLRTVFRYRGQVCLQPGLK